jgi:hypothetical protein
MKTKFVGILVCLLLMTTVFSIGKPIERETRSPTLNDPSLKTFSVDVPVWHIGDSWSYEITTLTAHIEVTNQSYNFTIATGNLTLEVINDAGSTYSVAFNAPKINGDVNISFILEGGFINITANLNDTKLNGTIVCSKSDLGIQQIRIYLSGNLHAKITELPSISLRRPIPIRGAAEISLIAEYNVSYTLISFPFDVGSFWGRPAVNISVGGTIHSRGLDRMNIINNIARRHWRFVEFVTRILGIDSAALKNMSDIFYDILPIVNISDVLNTYFSGNVFKIAQIPLIFYCGEEPKDVTVQAGTFHAYNISLVGDLGNIYYAPDVRNIIKISGHFTQAIPYIRTIEIQLIHTNYS